MHSEDAVQSSTSRWRVLARRVNEQYPIMGALRINRYCFGNSLPLKLNLRFLFYLWRCRLAPHRHQAMSPALKAAQLQLKKHGYVVLEQPADPTLVAKLSRAISQLVEENKTSVTPGIEEWMIQIRDCAKNLPDIFQLISPNVVAVLEEYYGSYFRIHAADVYRIVPTSNPPQLGGLWHTDDFPPGAMKIMVYLTDCPMRQGALKVHSSRKTKSLVRRGFFDRYHAAKFSSELQDGWVVLEGKAGTIILWDPTIIHRATPPEENFRDAVAFHLRPSMEPWERHFDRMREKLSIERKRALIHYENPALD